MTSSLLEANHLWETWIVENLGRGVAPEAIVLALESRQVPSDVAWACITRISQQKNFKSYFKQTRPIRQTELYLALRRQLDQLRSSPQGIRELDSIDPTAFFEDFYFENRPVVIRGYANHWPAKQKWTLEYLAKHYGDVTVEITDNRLSNPHYDMQFKSHSKSCSLRSFITRVSSNNSGNDAYMVANNRTIEQPEMSSLVDDICYDNAMFDKKRWRGCSAFWLGPAGTVTPLHHDTCNIMFVQLSGRKKFRLFSPLELDLLNDARSMYADLDPEDPDLDRHPNFQTVLERSVILNPGDAIFLPVGWWHHVRALDISISFAMTNFIVPNHFDWYRPGEVS